jgi:ferritin
MIVNPKIVPPINEQIGNEFSAMLQYYAIAAHFGAEALPELSSHFRKQAEEEKEHALRFIQFLLDAGGQHVSFAQGKGARRSQLSRRCDAVFRDLPG